MQDTRTRKTKPMTGYFDQQPVTGKVVQMDRFRSGKSLSPIRQAEAYWCALRGNSLVPRRSQVDPRGLENILSKAFILERIAPGIARFRLAGNHLTELTGMEVRGMPLASLFSAGARGQIGDVLEHVFDSPAIAEMSLSCRARPGRGALEARMILLPLQSDFGEISRALGVLVADGPMFGAAAVRFDLDRTSLRSVANPIGLDTPAPVPAPGFAESQAPIRGATPQLRLVE